MTGEIEPGDEEHSDNDKSAQSDIESAMAACADRGWRRSERRFRGDSGLRSLISRCIQHSRW